MVHFKEFLSMGEKSKGLGIGQNPAVLLSPVCSSEKWRGHDLSHRVIDRLVR